MEWNTLTLRLITAAMAARNTAILSNLQLLSTKHELWQITYCKHIISEAMVTHMKTSPEHNSSCFANMTRKKTAICMDSIGRFPNNAYFWPHPKIFQFRGKRSIPCDLQSVEDVLLGHDHLIRENQQGTLAQLLARGHFWWRNNATMYSSWFKVI